MARTTACTATVTPAEGAPEANSVNEEFLPTAPAAKFLGLSTSFLEKARLTGRGPKFYKLPGGRAVRYRKSDLVAFMTAGAATSTSQWAT